MNCLFALVGGSNALSMMYEKGYLAITRMFHVCNFSFSGLESLNIEYCLQCKPLGHKSVLGDVIDAGL